MLNDKQEVIIPENIFSLIKPRTEPMYWRYNFAML